MKTFFISTKKTVTFLFLMIGGMVAFAQDITGGDDDSGPMIQEKKGFHFGLTLGSYFANQYTSSLYDGYGFDIDGNRNNFENSFMYQKIINQYGGYGYSGMPDQIAQALNVDYHTWTFDESDMPINMHYTPAFVVGLAIKYSTNKKNAILLNLNASKLSISGNFTIITPQQAQSTQINDRIKYGAIKGGEQRLLFQFGYQQILGDNPRMNFFVEGGLNVTLAKFDKESILINNLQIDLLSYYNTTLYNTGGPIKRPIGTGFGAFAGAGANLTMSPKWTIQLLYSPTYEKINIGVDPSFKLQHSILMRAYYILEKGPLVK